MDKRIIFLLFFLILAASVGTQLHGAVISVTTTEDNVPGSLRAAITTANTNGEDDTINLPAWTYVLTVATGEEANLSGDLDINNANTVTVIGAGSGKTIIDGNGTDRVFHPHTPFPPVFEGHDDLFQGLRNLILHPVKPYIPSRRPSVVSPGHDKTSQGPFAVTRGHDETSQGTFAVTRGHDRTSSRPFTGFSRPFGIWRDSMSNSTIC